MDAHVPRLLVATLVLPRKDAAAVPLVTLAVEEDTVVALLVADTATTDTAVCLPAVADTHLHTRLVTRTTATALRLVDVPSRLLPCEATRTTDTAEAPRDATTLLAIVITSLLPRVVDRVWTTLLATSLLVARLVTTRHPEVTAICHHPLLAVEGMMTCPLPLLVQVVRVEGIPMARLVRVMTTLVPRLVVTEPCVKFGAKQHVVLRSV